ncbi:MAG: hypothetical protein NTV42_05095 [Chloroflexi bacterium]|nr:hypothetical protein [Chloroflexota bacterium]
MRIPYISLALLIIASAVLSFLPTRVYATSITLAPSSGITGSKIVLTGDGFIGKVATIYWDDKKIIQSVPVSKTGQINYSFEIPSSAKGTHIVKVTDDSNWSNITATANFSITPSVLTEPPFGKINTRIYIFGYGFAPNESGIKYTWDGKPLSKSPIQADKAGSWNSQFDVPSDPKGEYTIGVTSDSTGSGEVPGLVFTVSPFCKATPLSGPVGTKITLTGVGFRPGEDGLTFTWDGPIIDTNLVAQPNGSFSIVITVPPCVKGRHILGIYGSSFTPIGIVPDIEFEVTPSIQLTPSNVMNSRDLKIDGTGYNEGEILAINYDKSNTGVTTTTDAMGNFSVTIQVPVKPGKEHTVEATGNKGGLAQAIYVSGTLPPPLPQLLFPGPGATVQSNNSVVDVIISIFKSTGGLFNGGSTSQSNKPAGIITAMNWSVSGDQTGVNYSLQISRTADFVNVVVNKDGIVGTTYNLDRSNLASAGTYYWRVRASNETGDVSPWSNYWAFEFVPTSPLVMAIAVTILILILAMLIFAVLAIINRNRNQD